MPIRLGGIASNLDTDAIIKELMSAQSLKKTKIENKITKHEWKQEKWKDLNSKIYKLYTGSLSKMRMQSSYNVKKASSSNESALTATANSNAPSGAHKIAVTQLASAQYVTGEAIKTTGGSTVTSTTKLSDITGASSAFSLNGSDMGVNGNSTVADFVAACKTKGLNASFDEGQGRFFISSKESGAANTFSFGGVDLSKLGLPTDYSTDSLQVTTAKDAEFTLNGAALTSATNNVTVNGLSLELKEKTTSDVTLTVTKDTDAAYDMVKGFIKEYNELLDQMNDNYYAASARKYEPLTDEQKEEMSDDEIKKWEDKIKDSLLRRDDTLSGLLSSMKSTLSKSVKLDSDGNGTEETYSLSSFGITSVVYTEKGKLHIDGDSDDSLTADMPDKLKKALEDDPDTVIQVLSKLAGDLYSDMQDKMKSSTLSSALTFYNDKEMGKTLTNYESQLSTMEKKLKDIEDRYYKQFSAMEKAMSTLNSQSGSLASMLSS